MSSIQAPPFLLPLLAVVATALVAGLFVDELDYFYPLRVAVGFAGARVVPARLCSGASTPASWAATSFRGTPLASASPVYALWIGILRAERSLRIGSAAGGALPKLATPLIAVWIIGRVLGSVLLVPIVGRARIPAGFY